MVKSHFCLVVSGVVTLAEILFMMPILLLLASQLNSWLLCLKLTRFEKKHVRQRLLSFLIPIALVHEVCDHEFIVFNLRVR